jgi:hypothetical protein
MKFMTPYASTALIFCCFGLAVNTARAETVRDISGGRIELHEVLPGAPAELAGVDLGASPPPGSSRVLTREQLKQQITQAGFDPAPLDIPQLTRVQAAGKRWSATELSDWLLPAVRQALPPGVSLLKLKTSTSLLLSPDASIGEVRLAKLPKRTGTVQAGLSVVLLLDQEATHHLPLVAVVNISEQAAGYAVSSGADVSLVVRYRTLRVSAAATALKDGDIGDTVPFRVKSSGKTLLARLTSRQEAEVVESP